MRVPAISVLSSGLDFQGYRGGVRGNRKSVMLGGTNFSVQ